MKKINSFLFIIILIGFFVVPQGMAQEKGNSLSLKDTLNVAFQNNPGVMKARNDMNISRVKYKQVKKWANPEFGFGLSKFPYDLENDSRVDSDLLEGEVSFSQPVEMWGKKGLKKKIAQDEIKQAEAEFQRVWLKIVREIREQYTETLLHQKNIELAQENLDLNRRLLDQVQVKFNTGEAMKHELARVRLEEAKARNFLLGAQKEFRVDFGKLNLLLGREITVPMKLTDTFSAENLTQSYDDLMALAMSQRKDILIQQKQVEIRSKQVDLAKRQKLPDISLSAGVEREDQILSGAIGIAFEIPLWNQFSAEIERAKLDQKNAEISFEALKNEVNLEVYTAFEEADLAQKALNIFDEAMKEANEILRLVNLDYQEGTASFLIYLEGIITYQETKQSYFESLAEYARRMAILEETIGKSIDNKEEIQQ